MVPPCDPEGPELLLLPEPLLPLPAELPEEGTFGGLVTVPQSLPFITEANASSCSGDILDA